jgi:hypothetical protein
MIDGMVGGVLSGQHLGFPFKNSAFFFFFCIDFLKTQAAPSTTPQLLQTQT